MTPLYAPRRLDPDRLGLTVPDRAVEDIAAADILYQIAYQLWADREAPAGQVAARRRGAIVIGTPDWYAALGGDPDAAALSPTGWGTPRRAIRLPRTYGGTALPDDAAAALGASGVDIYPTPDPLDPAGVIGDDGVVQRTSRLAELWVPVAAAEFAPRRLFGAPGGPPRNSETGGPERMLDITAVAELGKTVGGDLYLACPKPRDFFGGGTDTTSYAVVSGETVNTVTGVITQTGTAAPGHALPPTTVVTIPEPAATGGYEATPAGAASGFTADNSYQEFAPDLVTQYRWVERLTFARVRTKYRPTAVSEPVFELLRQVYGPRCRRLRIAGESPDAAGADFGYGSVEELAADVRSFFAD